MRRIVAALAVPALILPLAFTSATVGPHAPRAALAQSHEDDPLAAHKEALRPLAPLVGSFRFARKDGYEKTFENGWALDGSTLLWRSRTVIPGGEVVYEDILVASFDPARKRLRARQWAHGACSTYDVEVAPGRITMTEVETEGPRPEPWRYTITILPEGGFKYVVEKKAGEGWKPYIGHELKRTN